MARIKPTEIRLVADLLDPDRTDPDASRELAEEIIVALDEKREKDDLYIIAARLADWAPITAYGPWSTKNQALKFSKHLSGEGQPRAVIVKITQEDDILKRLGLEKK